MKCLKCDEKIKNNDKYCANCGSKVNKENKIIKFIIKNKKKIILTIVVIVLMIILYNILNYVTGPVFTANKYLNNVINNNTDELLKTINLETNEFFNEKKLKEKNSDLSSATNIEIFNKVITEEEAFITYSYKLDGQNYIASISLSKDNKLFSKWKINSGKVTKKVSFKVPTGSIIKIDDINIEKYINKVNEYYDLYTIDYMATGIYKIEITLKDGTILTDDIDVQNDKTYLIDKIELQKETEEKLKNKTKELIGILYNGIKENKNSSEIDYNDNIKKIYKNLNYNYKNSDYKINSIEYNDIEIIKARYNDAAKLEVTFQTEYNYNVTYDTENNFEGINRGYVTIVFDYDKEYKIESIENLKNSFPIRK